MTTADGSVVKGDQGEAEKKGLIYAGRIVGKTLYRIRESHVRDHYVPLMKKGAVGAVKLDLLLRGIALLPEHTGGRREAIGRVSPYASYEDLHDLIRSPDLYSNTPESPYDYDDAQQRKLKREWIREQIEKLEELKLVSRVVHESGGRPRLVARRDDGSGKDLDDPSGTAGSSYLTTLGSVFSSKAVRDWGTPEVSFYFAAMIAERHHRFLSKQSSLPGGGEWFQALTWFADKEGYRGEGHVKIPFSIATLDRGLRSFLNSGLLEKRLTRKNPLTGANFRRGSRNVYTNKFAELDTGSRVVEIDLMQDPGRV